MAEVSVLGMGAMGSRLANVLLECGHEVTVWNRSASERAAAVEAAGARRAASPAQAAAAAPLVLMCVTDYPAAGEVLAAPGVLDALAGRVFVQFTNGTEDQVRAQLHLLTGAGVRMLSGAIAAYPRHIGRPDTLILYAGDASAYEEHEAVLADLAGGGRFTGEDPGPMNAVYVASFAFYYAALGGFFEAAALARARGVPPREFAAALPALAALLLDHVEDAARRIEEEDYAGDQATVDIHLAGSSRRLTTFAALGLQARMTAAFAEYCREAAAAGDGGEDIAAVFKRLAAGPGA
jgi:3-hydroxyisobutyrate dehydrogenase-like beta-hydroxyacid dehydrogenase